ncbi:heme/hemin ABC transporter substrate-binding protein [Arenibacterium halophilum]|uniref:Hemin ABC transporter substrate-binding protein n=1 Tax=Arenibacterium halophilum TaxID=2583821 RepID=A0ABY2X9I6_9RHOB|nr:ABC transporter substrate-binding protein [Arenibacterium halophilum]TMV13033.1 hemin ABC transporter substrate-binding protein [Arenibacterium halophilum]
MIARFAGAALALSLAMTAAAQDRVIAAGGSVTEIVYALGQQDRLIARDTTSVFPPEVTALPDVGYLRALSPEGVLAQAPDLVIAEADAGPPATMEVLRAAGVPVVTLQEAFSAEGIAAKITAVGAALNQQDVAAALAMQISADMAQAQALARDMAPEDQSKVLFILTLQDGKIMAAGQDTGADAMIALAGGQNAAQGFSGYKLMSDEAVIQAAPEVILMMDRARGHALDDAALFALPALSGSPAAETGAVIRMNGLYLLGFGPRTAQAIGELSQALYDR